MRWTKAHRIVAVLVPLAVIAVVQACSTSSNDGNDSNDASDANDNTDSKDAGPYPHAYVTIDAANCTILAASFDDSCDASEGCEVVVPGGNVCDPCSNETGALFCWSAALPPRSAAAFYAVFAPVLAAEVDASGNGIGYPGCTGGGCPSGGRAVCERGKCMFTYDDGEDASAPDD